MFTRKMKEIEAYLNKWEGNFGFGLEHSKAPKAAYNMVHTGYSGGLSGLERD